MKLNRKGFTEVSILVSVIVGLITFFVPNPLSQTIGIGNKQNKVVQADTTTQTLVPAMADGETLYHKDGSVAMVSQAVYKHKDLDEQQHVTLWEQIRSLPATLIVLVVLGAFFPPLGAFLAMLWARAKKAYAGIHSDTKRIVTAMDRAFATVPLTLAGESLPGEIDRAELSKRIVDAMKNELGYNYNDSTKNLVRSMR